MAKILHLGCGRKGRSVPNFEEGDEVVTLDADGLVDPDIVCELGAQTIPLPDHSFHRAVAIHVLEHIGRQGYTKVWFAFWEELYRVLKPNGELYFESPLYSSVWCWADPGHARALSPQSFLYFDQDSYRIEGSSISPYRIRCDFKPVSFRGLPDGNVDIREREQFSHFAGTLRAQKPLKPWWKDEG